MSKHIMLYMPCICLYAKQSKCIDKMNNDESRDKRTKEKRVVKCFIRRKVMIVLHVHLHIQKIGICSITACFNLAMEKR